ncbi:hypothetical protein AKJ09_07152 [Labilithrix luteola]|uniref:Uncharacterized protein n=1 Tax=Labilithrix luteola TaxID=1391654 RepID=A0A0K1Q430_9BACT|nr:hypothetical protein AKJ09_07152 [Labilithrix luteola]
MYCEAATWRIAIRLWIIHQPPGERPFAVLMDPASSEWRHEPTHFRKFGQVGARSGG